MGEEVTPTEWAIGWPPTPYETKAGSDPERDPRVRAGCRALRPDIPWDITGAGLRRYVNDHGHGLTMEMRRIRDQVRAVLAAADGADMTPQTPAARAAKQTAATLSKMETVQFEGVAGK